MAAQNQSTPAEGLDEQIQEEVEQVDEAAKHKLLQQSKLDSVQYQKAKKLKGFNKSDYKWNPNEQLYYHKNYKMKKETVKQVDELSTDTLKSYSKKAGREADNHAVAGDKYSPGEAGKKYHDKKMDKRQRGQDRADQKVFDRENPVKESVEQVDELSKGTLGSYVKKASQSAADHGMQAGRKQAERDEVDRSTNRHGNVDRDAVHKAMKTTQSDIKQPEKKAAKRLKGINTAVKKLTGEEVDQVDEQNCGCGQNPCKTYGKVDEAKATMCGRCGTKHVAPKDGGKCPAVKEQATESFVSDRTKELMLRAIKRNT